MCILFFSKIFLVIFDLLFSFCFIFSFRKKETKRKKQIKTLVTKIWDFDKYFLLNWIFWEVFDFNKKAEFKSGILQKLYLHQPFCGLHHVFVQQVLSFLQHLEVRLLILLPLVFQFYFDKLLESNE